MKLTPQTYWEEIEATTLDPAVKGQLKEMVNSHLHNVIPPGASDRTVKLLKESGVTTLELQDNAGNTQILEVTVFLPESEKYRQFTYLRNTYPHGKNVSIDQIPE